MCLGLTYFRISIIIKEHEKRNFGEFHEKSKLAKRIGK